MRSEQGWLDWVYREIERYRREYRDVRYGQAAFNVVHDRWPVLANRYRGTDLDPYYHDERAPQFVHTCVQERHAGCPAWKIASNVHLLHHVCQALASSTDLDELQEWAVEHRQELAELSQLFKTWSNLRTDLGIDQLIERLQSLEP